ncbi:hypothetical protein, partial [Klebsiella pneumoniae]|uniref:hypothetical protein n=1 Tax=Klebsiella pneumoniae TaxID=573 RepID=UPI001A91B8CB
EERGYPLFDQRITCEKISRRLGVKLLYVPPWSTVTIVHIYNNLRSVFHHFLLLFLTESGIFYPHLQNQAPGLEP